jgi:hypothetical protein
MYQKLPIIMPKYRKTAALQLSAPRYPSFTSPSIPSTVRRNLSLRGWFLPEAILNWHGGDCFASLAMTDFCDTLSHDDCACQRAQLRMIHKRLQPQFQRQELPDLHGPILAAATMFLHKPLHSPWLKEAPSFYLILR